MAERQYIGARYVPIFGGDWNPNESYDALVIVKYQNKTYTSKIPVPPGIQITNETYWVLSGNVDANITDIQNRLAIVETIANDNKTLVKGRKFLFMGDSYDVIHPTGWSDTVKQVLGIPNDNFFKLSAGGIGFTRDQDRTFLKYLTDNWQSKISNPNEITDIIVCGGANDIFSNTSAIKSAILNFKAYCKSIFPNAILRIGMIGYRNDNTFKSEMRMVRNAYLQACENHGIPYLKNVESIMHYYPLFMDDHLHPNNLGVMYLGGGIAQAIVQGSASVLYNENITPHPVENGSISDYLLNTTIVGDKIFFTITLTTFTFPQELSPGNVVALGTYNSNIFKGSLTTMVYNTAGPLGVLEFNTKGQIVFHTYKTIAANAQFTVYPIRSICQDVMYL